MKLNPLDYPYHVSKYQAHENKINMQNIDYPVPYQEITLIKKINNVRFNVYGYDDKNEITILYVSEKPIPDVINLPLISDGKSQH